MISSRRILTALGIVTLAAACTAPARDSSRAQSESRSTVVFLVRHGEKSEQAGDDPPLSDAGRARAAALEAALRDAQVTRVITTQWHRTQETAAPVAQLAHLRPIVVPVDLNNISAYIGAVADSVRHHGGVTLVVGHQNTVPALLTALGGPAVPEICAGDYGDLYVLVLADPPSLPSLTHAMFGSPHPTHGAACGPGR
jgi:broad specificity phosphatase PhoE